MPCHPRAPPPEGDMAYTPEDISCINPKRQQAPDVCYISGPGAPCCQAATAFTMRRVWCLLNSAIVQNKIQDVCRYLRCLHVFSNAMS
jgi:hypothetical protein